MGRSIRIVLADDHAVAREGIHALLQGEDDMEVVGQAPSGARAVELAAELRPDVVIMDARMPGPDGLEATARIVSSEPDVRVLILSMLKERRFVAEALGAGASGYVTKRAGCRELVAAVRAVAAGRQYLSAGLKPEPTAANPRPPAVPRDPVSCLTPREVEVLRRLSEGRSTHETAELLGIAESTVAAHRRNLKAKLDADNTAELVRAAIRAGIALIE